MDFEYKEEYRYLTNVCLNVTDDCCAACRYCFVQQNPHFMNLDTAKDAVLWLLQNRELKKSNKDVSVNFFGGEPTLLWDEIIVPLVTWSKENNQPVHYSMTTNGMLLNEERIKWLYDNKFGLLLSIDGDEFTQNYNRPYKGKEKSFDLVSKNIPFILKYFPNITFRATIDVNTVEHTFENYLFAVKSGFRNIFFAPNERREWPQEKLEILKQELAKIYSYMSFCFNNDMFPLRWSTIDKSIKDIIFQKQKPKTILRCGLGTTSGSIGYDGSIYGCQEQDSKNNSIFYIGDIYNGINKQLHSNLLNNYQNAINPICENKDICNYCLIQNKCENASCPSSNYDLFKQFNKKTELYCLWHNWIFINSKFLLNDLIKKQNKTFKQYWRDFNEL